MAAVTAKKLLTPVTVGGVELQNRVVLAPMTRGRAEEDGTPNDMMVEYYRQRGNIGLVISEGACISKQGHGWHYAPGIYNEQHRDAWKKVVQVVHERGGKFAMQLWHLGRQCHSEVTGSPIVAPSPIPVTNDVNAKNGEKRTPEVPQELSEEGIKEIVEDYGKAAELAIAAGCDFVELHAANGYLVDLFIQGKTNQRQDKYGGSIENRLRFVNEVLDRILKSVPASKVGIKLSPNGVFGEMGTADNTEVFSALLESLAARKIAFVDFVDGLAFGFHELHPQFTLAMARKILGDNVALFGGCGYSVEDGEKAIESGDGDMIVYGRPTIGNPDFIERIRDGLELSEVPPMDVWYNKSKGKEGYVDLERKVPL